MKTRHPGTLVTGLIAGSLIAVCVPAADAHHSFAAYNMKEEKTVTGVIRRLEWTNPHVLIWLDVPNGKGGVDTFSFEGKSPNFLERFNWTRTTLKPGDNVGIAYRPLRDGARGGMLVSARKADGSVFTMLASPAKYNLEWLDSGQPSSIPGRH